MDVKRVSVGYRTLSQLDEDDETTLILAASQCDSEPSSATGSGVALASDVPMLLGGQCAVPITAISGSICRSVLGAG